MVKNIALRIAPYIPWLTAYAIATGTLYLWGYWSKFHLNILEYIGLLELATATVLPLLSALFGVVGGLIISSFFTSEAFPDGGGKKTAIGHALNRRSKLLLFVYLTIVLVGFPFVASADTQAYVVPLALSPLIAFAVLRSDFLLDLISNPSIRGTVVSILTVVMCSAFGHGRTQADQIVEGRQYFAIEVEALPNVPAKYIKQAGDFKYLGHTKDYFFVLAPDNSILVLRTENTPSVALIYRSTMALWPSWIKD